MLIAFLHVAAKGVSQNVTVAAKNKQLKDVLRDLSRQSGVSIIFRESEMKDNPPVTMQVKDGRLEDVLKSLLEMTDFTFIVKNNVVIVDRKPPVAPATPAAVQDTGVNIVGMVMDAAGVKLLPGVSVSIKGTTRGTTTDAIGKFELKNVPAKAVLIITSVGYQTQIIPAVDPKNSNLLRVISLKESISELDEAVVIAYGKTTKRLATGNVTMIKGADIASQPTANLMLALEGRVPGLSITPMSGYAHGPLKVEIRGRNSVNPNLISDPLYIIDGVPLTILELQPAQHPANSSTVISKGYDQTGLSPLGGQSPLFNINPADIESVEVLKDADATAIYGSRGANGVILINTKRGKPGPMRLSAGLQEGVNIVTRTMPMLNTTQYLAARRLAFANDGITPSKTPGAGFAPELFVFDTTRNVNWQKLLYGGVGKWTTANVDLTGGNEFTTFRIGGGYNRSTDITATSGASQKANVAMSLINLSKNQRFRMALQLSYNTSKVNMMSLSGNYDIAPDAPSIYDSNGHPNYKEWDIANAQYPFQFSFFPYVSRSSMLNGGMTLSYHIMKGLDIRADLGYGLNEDNQVSTHPISSMDNYKPVFTPLGVANFGNTRGTNLQTEPQIEYNNYTGKGHLNVLLGGSYQSSVTTATRLNGQGYTNDLLLGSITNAPAVIAEDWSSYYKYAGVFGRIGYTWAEKYIINLNGRRDGSSRFGPGNRFGNFGAVGAAWIASEEPFIKNVLPEAVSFLKLRGSYGLTGSDAVPDYAYLAQWGNPGTSDKLSSYNDVPPLIPILQANPNFHWQVNRKLEAALDFGFVKDMIVAEIAWYRNRCNNQLISYPTPAFSGFTSVVENSPADVQNTGVELSVSARIIQRNDVAWTSSFNISHNTNKLLAFPHLAESPYANQYKIGHSLDERYEFHYQGVDPQTGLLTFLDANKDGKITENDGVPAGTQDDDRIVTINLAPKFEGSWSNTVRYKTISLSLTFGFAKRYTESSYNLNVNSLAGYGNMQPEVYTESWTHPGQQARYPKLTTFALGEDRAFYGESDAHWVDGSYLRLRSASLSYSLPTPVAKRIGMSSFSLALSAQNLFVITGYKGLDPEFGGLSGVPPSRTITGGINCSF